MGIIGADQMNKSVKDAFNNEKPCHIFVDMDGVLSDFDTHATAQGKYDDKGQTKWNDLDLEWWKTMPVFEGAREFYKSLHDIGNTHILTAPVPSSDCFAGKAEWVEKKFSPERGRFALLELIICRAVDKQLMARPNCILVDDREKNVKEWVAAGGIGIHHKGDFAETLRLVEQAVTDFEKKSAPKPPQSSTPKP